MAKYIYDKYYIVESYIETILKTEQYALNLKVGDTSLVRSSLYQSITINQTTGKLVFNGFVSSSPVYSAIGMHIPDYTNNESWRISSFAQFYNDWVMVNTDKIGVIISHKRGSFITALVAENGTYPVNGRHSDGYWYVRGGLANEIPTIILDTTNNRTLYENDVLGITGNAKDTDSGDVVSVKYSINSGAVRAITSAISSGANIPFNKSLSFIQNKLFDGTTEVTGILAEGTQHTLKVWAEDDKGGKSVEQTRVFYVVPNRPATLTINPFSPATDLINTDRVTVSGSVSDPDNNTVKVLYKIANGSFIEIYDGSGGEFSFQVLLSNLIIGVNTITIQAKDSYGAITNKTLQITKTENLQSLKTAVARYKLTAPNGTARGIVLWIEREVGDLLVDAEISMGMNGDAENFVPMTKTATAFVREGIEEDEFTFDAGIAKENIILKLTMTRASTVSNKGITLISGVLS